MKCAGCDENEAAEGESLCSTCCLQLMDQGPGWGEEDVRREVVGKESEGTLRQGGA